MDREYSAISEIKSIPFWPISSNRPKNGDTYVAPALAANNAWLALKISVTFVLIPCFVRAEQPSIRLESLVLSS